MFSVSFVCLFRVFSAGARIIYYYTGRAFNAPRDYSTILLMTPGDLASIGYGGLPDLTAVMRYGPTRLPEITQADVTDSDVATAQTISRMCELIKESCADPLFQSVALKAASSFPGGVASSIWWTVKHMMRFVQDSPALARMFGPHDALELLVSPAAMIRCRKMEGDCDDFTTMACAMLQCNGVPFEIVTVAANPYDRETFSHVYGRADRFAMDVSHGKYPGWEVPKERQFRVQSWDSEGNPIESRASFSGLHGYYSEPTGFPFSGFNGLGQDDDDDDDGSGDDGTTTVIGPPPIDTGIPAMDCATGFYLSAGGSCLPNPASGQPYPTGTAAPASTSSTTSSSSSSSNTALDNVLASLATTWSKIAGQAINPTVTTCNSAGVCTSAPAGSAAASVLASSVGGIPTSYLLIGGVVLVGILLLSGKK